MHLLLSSSLLHSIILAIFLGRTLILVQSVTLESDVQVLRELKQSIDPFSIPRYSFLSTWDFTMDPCESTEGFLGILCSFPLDQNTTYRITAIDLDDGGYDGFLTPTIGSLTELTTLSLNENKFRGPIPGSVSNLKQLTRLSLSANLFTGSITNGITKLRKLEFLDLSQNHLSGSVPVNISGLRCLKHLSLSSNALIGKIPDLSGLWQLQTLDLGDNQLSGNLPSLPISLITLSLKQNVLSGHISPVKTLKRLKSLDVSDNRLSGPILEEVLTLPDMVTFNVSVNQFTAIEAVVFPPKDLQLEVLDAHLNRLHGHLPSGLAAMERLISLDLSNNQFFGPIPKDYGIKLGNPWKSLFLDNNFLAGNLPPQFVSTKTTFKGSFADNCLRCPVEVGLCSGGQRADAECIGKNQING